MIKGVCLYLTSFMNACTFVMFLFVVQFFQIQSRFHRRFTSEPIVKQQTLISVLNDRQHISHFQARDNYTNSRRKRWLFRIKSFIVKHQRLYILLYSLLYKIVFQRCLSLLDIYTDLTVAYLLYINEETLWFTISVIFIVTPFIASWTAGMRIVYLINKDNEVRHDKNKSENNNNLKQKSSFQDYLYNIASFLYIFPPFGAFFLFVVEIVWIVYDILNSLYGIIKGDLLIIEGQTSRYNRYESLKTYRKFTELFGETVRCLVLPFVRAI